MIALVTGASRGIGRACAVELAKSGHHVLINYRSQEDAALETLKRVDEAGGSGELVPFDVSSYSEVTKGLEPWSGSNEKTIQILVNNAGITRDGLFVWMEKQQWDDVLNTSTHGFFNVTRCIIERMLRKRYGRIINMVSVSGLKGTAGQVNYSAAKGALIGATKALAQEVAKRKITVNAVAPGFIRTDMTSGLDESEIKKLVPAGRLGEVEEVASLVAYLASPAAGYITGETISINGGIYS